VPHLYPREREAAAKEVAMTEDFTAEDQARSEISVVDLIDEDLDDPDTPSDRREANPAAGFYVSTQPRRRLADREGLP
jgi:hypothetical protein